MQVPPSLVISLLALGFTLFSFWWMNWRPGHVIVTEPRSYAAASVGGKILVEVPLVFFNRGATAVVITNLQLLLEGVEKPLRFNAVVQKLGDHSDRRFATQFPVRAQEAVSLICEFQRDVSGFAFRPRAYSIRLQGVYGNSKKWKTLLEFKLNVAERDAASINKQFISHDNWQEDEMANDDGVRHREEGIVGMADADLKGILDRVQNWGIAADNKVNVLTAIQAAVFAYLLPKAGEWIQKPTTSIYMNVFLTSGFLLLAVGLWKCIDAIFPRTKNTHRIKSLTFFGDINALSVDEYRARLREMTPEKWAEDYISQIHTNAVIATSKHRNIKLAVTFFGAGLVVLGVCYAATLLGGW